MWNRSKQIRSKCKKMRIGYYILFYSQLFNYLIATFWVIAGFSRRSLVWNTTQTSQTGSAAMRFPTVDCVDCVSIHATFYVVVIWHHYSSRNAAWYKEYWCSQYACGRLECQGYLHPPCKCGVTCHCLQLRRGTYRKLRSNHAAWMDFLAVHAL